MSPVADTVAAILDRHGAEVAVWSWFALLPILVPAAVAIARRRMLRGKARYVLASAARILGYSALIVLVVLVPCAAANVFLVPALLDAHPGARAFLAAPLAASDWVAANWLVASVASFLLWPVWVVAAALHGARQWQPAHSVR